MIIAAVCTLVILIGAGLFLKICRPEIQEIMAFLSELVHAALSEFRFQGGRSAKANILLCVMLAFLFIFLSVHTTLSEVIGIVGGRHENATAYLCGLFGGLILFFLASICFVAVQETYAKKIRD